MSVCIILNTHLPILPSFYLCPLFPAQTFAQWVWTLTYNCAVFYFKLAKKGYNIRVTLITALACFHVCSLLSTLVALLNVWLVDCFIWKIKYWNKTLFVKQSSMHKIEFKSSSGDIKNHIDWAKLITVLFRMNQGHRLSSESIVNYLECSGLICRGHGSCST